jgi:outer membrane lipoprotein-sorting protein
MFRPAANMCNCARPFIAPVALLALVLLSGCRMNEAVYTPNGDRIIYMRPPLVKVVEELDDRHLAAESVCANLNVTLHDNEKGKVYQLVGTYLGDKDGNLRLQVKATTGQTILDMAVFNDKMDVWLPRKNRYFRGNRQDLLNASECQLSLFAHVGAARDLFFPRAWSTNATERRVTFEHGREIISVIEKPGFIRKRSRRLTVAPEAATVEAVEVYDKYGREVGTVNYSDYRMPGPALPEADALGLLYPNRVVLQSHNARHTLELEIDQIEFNTDIGEDKFHVRLPENQRIMDLDAKLRRCVNLWE